MSCALTCIEVDELAADLANVTWIERVRYRLHRLTCRRCRAVMRESQPPRAWPTN
jgi:hypothetical protein